MMSDPRSQGPFIPDRTAGETQTPSRSQNTECGKLQGYVSRKILYTDSIFRIPRRGNNKNGRCVFRKGTASALTCMRWSVTACGAVSLAPVGCMGNFILLQDREKRDFLPVPTVSQRILFSKRRFV